MEVSDEAKKLLKTAKQLGTFKEDYAKEILNPKIDKYGIGFDSDNRFKVFGADIIFSAHSGYYGDSSCCVFSNGVDSKLASTAFKEAVVKHEDLILKTMSDILSDKAKGLIKDVTKEVLEATKILEELNDLVKEKEE